MPELAEVEYVARQLRESVVGAVIDRAEIAWPGTIAGMSPAIFTTIVAGATIEGVERRGKVLLMLLDLDRVLLVHRRMTGNLTLVAPGTPDEPYLRATLWLTDGRRILYTDPRKFGRLTLAPRDHLANLLADLGPEPLAPDFTAARLAAILATKRGVIKTVLLNQSVIAGLGNIYADEALYAARIHPLRPADSLAPAEVKRLHAAIIGVLTTGIEHGGTTIGRHRDLYGDAGANLSHIRAYRRTGLPCDRCGTPIARLVIGQRSAHFCPTCQKL